MFEFLRRQEKRSWPTLSLDDAIQQWMSFNGGMYGLGMNQTLQNGREEIQGDFAGIVQGAYKANGVVFACILARQLLFSEARFQFRERRNGRPGNLFGNSDLEILERPWPNGTTGGLLARMEQDSSLAGNFYAHRALDGLERMRPDWVSIILGSDLDEDDPGAQVDAKIVGYAYWPGGRKAGVEPQVFLPEEVVHYAPIPDPTARFRGMSWLTPVLLEIMSDGAATRHKLKFFENGATPNIIVKLDLKDQVAFDKWVDTFRKKNESVDHAYKTLFLAAGADPMVVGANLRQLDFKNTQGAGETRIAAAAGVPPVIVGLSEGLQAATYSNYGQARRRFADGTMRPLWREAAASLAVVVNVPPSAELWYDDRDIAFLQEDRKDAAEIISLQAQSIRTLTDAGYEASSVTDAVTAGDLNRLKHTGLFSVQLQPAGSSKHLDQAGRSDEPDEVDPSRNGHSKEDIRV